EDFDVRHLLDLAALGTVADLVPLRDENRILVSAGLKRLNETLRPGLVALKEVSGIEHGVGVYEVGFQLGPRLNAAGRLEHAAAALNLLRAKDLTIARGLAQNLDSQNRARQDLEKQIARECFEAVRARFNPDQHFAIVEGNE